MSRSSRLSSFHGESWRKSFSVAATCTRKRRAVDDHPLFIDYAPDDRYKVHLKRR